MTPIAARRVKAVRKERTSNSMSMVRPLASIVGLLISTHLVVTSAAGPVGVAPVDREALDYWTRWRGPSGQGIVAGTGYTDTWSDTVNVKWKVDVPGRGHSSPIVWKDQLFLTTARDNGATVSMLAFRRSDGRLLWETKVPTTGIERAYWKNSHASATPTTDGRRVYSSFGTHGVAAFELDGRLAWHRKLGDLSNYHGSAGSPVLYQDRLFLYQDHDGTSTLRSYVAAFDTRTGNVIWKTDRVESVGWGTPVVIAAGDRDELIVSSQRKVYAYDPQSGAELWTVRGTTFEVIPTPVVGHGLVFCSSGRAGPTLAIRPGGRGDVTDTRVAWTSPRGSPFVPSAIVHGDLLYMINDMQSILTALDARTGEAVYQERLGEAMREGFSSSPVAVGDKIFFTNDLGQTFVVQAGRTFRLIRVNELRAQVLASPALVEGTWYWRTDRSLLAIGNR